MAVKGKILGKAGLWFGLVWFDLILTFLLLFETVCVHRRSMAVVLNQNTGPILKYRNQILETSRLCLQAPGIRRWKAESVHKHQPLLPCGVLRSAPDTDTPVPEPGLGKAGGRKVVQVCAFCRVTEARHRERSTLSRVARCKFLIQEN